MFGLGLAPLLLRLIGEAGLILSLRDLVLGAERDSGRRGLEPALRSLGGSRGLESDLGFLGGSLSLAAGPSGP